MGGMGRGRWIARAALGCAVVFAAAFSSGCAGGAGGLSAPSGGAAPAATTATAAPDVIAMQWGPDARLRAYDKVIVEEVEVWSGGHSRLTQAPPGDPARLAAEFRDIVVSRLSGDYRVVSQPGPGVLRVFFTVSQGQGSAPTGVKAAAAMTPWGRAAMAARKIRSATTEPLGGKPGVEVSLTDSVTHAVIGSGEDRWNVTGKDGSERAAFDRWAVRFLDTLRTRRASETPS